MLVPYQHFLGGHKRSDNTLKNGGARRRTRVRKTEPISEWIEHFSQRKQMPYWENTITGDTTWDNPVVTNETRHVIPEINESKHENVTRKHVWETKTSTTGTPYYENPETGETRFENPNIEPVIEDGYEIRFSETRNGLIYYVDIKTGESFWEKPTTTLSPISIESLVDNAESRLLKTLGIQTCKQIHDYLKESKLDASEQVAYIEIHAKDTSDLRKLLRSGNLNADQFRMLGEAGAEAMINLKNQVNRLISTTLTDEYDEETAECEILQKQVDEFYKHNQSIPKSTWRTVVNAAKSVFKTLWNEIKLLGREAFLLFWNNLPSLEQLRYGIAWFIQKGIDIAVWIGSNPKTAYYVIYGFIIAKKYACQAIGVAMNMLEFDPAELEIIAKIRKSYPEQTDPNVKESIGSQIYDFLRPHLETGLIQATASVSKSTLTGVKDLMKNGAVGLGGMGATGGVAAVVGSGGTLLAPIAGVALASVLYVAAGALIDTAVAKADEIAEEVTYWNDVRNSWNKVMEFIDPLPCIKEILRITEAKAVQDADNEVKFFRHLAKLSKLNLEEHQIKLENKKHPDIDDVKSAYKYCLNSRAARKFKDAELILQTLHLGKREMHELANLQYYHVDELWIQVAVFIWLKKNIFSGLLQSDFIPLEKDYGLIAKKDFIETQQTKLAEAASKSRYTSSVSNLQKWKLQFDKFKPKWDSNTTLIDASDPPVPPEIVLMLANDLQSDFTNYFNSQGNEHQIRLKTSLAPVLQFNEYKFKAIAIEWLYQKLESDPECDLSVRFPPWINGCIESVRDTVKTDKAIEAMEAMDAYNESDLKKLKFTDRLIHWRGNSPATYVVASAKVNEFMTEQNNTGDAAIKRQEFNSDAKDAFEKENDDVENRIQAFKEFQGKPGAPHEQFPRMMTLIIEPMKYFESEYAEAEKKESTIKRKKEIIQMVQCIKTRLGEPKRTKAGPLLNKQDVISKSTTGFDYYKIIAALYLQKRELDIYGESYILKKINGRDLWTDQKALKDVYGPNIKFNTPYIDPQVDFSVGWLDVTARAQRKTRKNNAGNKSIVGLDNTQYIATMGFVKLLICQNTHYPGLLKKNALAATVGVGMAAAATNAAHFATGGISTGILGLSVDLDDAQISSTNAMYHVYNQDISVKKQNTNPTIKEIFNVLGFPHPSIHPSLWSMFDGATSDVKTNINEFAKHDASHPEIAPHSVKLITCLLKGQKATASDGINSNVKGLLSKRSLSDLQIS